MLYLLCTLYSSTVLGSWLFHFHVVLHTDSTPCLMSKNISYLEPGLVGSPPTGGGKRRHHPTSKNPPVGSSACGSLRSHLPGRASVKPTRTKHQPPARHALIPTPGTIFSAMCSAVWAFVMLPNNQSSQRMGLESECLESLQKQILQKPKGKRLKTNTKATAWRVSSCNRKTIRSIGRTWKDISTSQGTLEPSKRDVPSAKVAGKISWSWTGPMPKLLGSNIQLGQEAYLDRRFKHWYTNRRIWELQEHGSMLIWWKGAS